MIRVLSLISLLLGIASCAYIETCPRQEEIYPCTCKENNDSGEIKGTCAVSYLNSLERLKQAVNGFSGKSNVDLELYSLKLGTVPSNFFYGILIKRLNIDRCELDTLSDDGRPVLLGLETSLEELRISDSFREENVPAKLRLGHMRKLKDIELSYNTITEMGDDWFERGPATLTYLTIYNNRIEKIGSRVFANVVYLKQLTLRGNRLGPIKRSMLPSPAYTLETLNLDDNALKTIPEDLFSNMPALTGISLKQNGILRLDQRTWYYVWQQLEFIHLEGNPMECDGHMNWIFPIQRKSAIYGRCHAPRENEGEDLQRFIDSRSRYRKD